MSLLQLKNIKKYYTMRQISLKFLSPSINTKKVIDGVSFELESRVKFWYWQENPAREKLHWLDSSWDSSLPMVGIFIF